MTADRKNTGTCHYTRTRETFWSSPIYTLLRKNSPYTETMSKGYNFLKDYVYQLFDKIFIFCFAFH